MVCCRLLYVHCSIAIILMRKRELNALLYLSSWCLVMVEQLFLTVPWGCLRLVIVVFPDHTHYFCTLPTFSSLVNSCMCVMNELTHTSHNCQWSRTHQYTHRQEVKTKSSFKPSTFTCVSTKY